MSAFPVRKRMGNIAKEAAVISSPAFLVVLLLVMESITTVLAQSASILVWNDIPGETLEITCGKPIQKTQYLTFGQTYYWKLSPSYWGKSKYYCFFRYQRRVQYFPVWLSKDPTPPVQYYPCHECVWHVNIDGFYVNEANEPFRNIAYTWLYK